MVALAALTNLKFLNLGSNKIQVAKRFSCPAKTVHLSIEVLRNKGQHMLGFLSGRLLPIWCDKTWCGGV